MVIFIYLFNKYIYFFSYKGNGPQRMTQICIWSSTMSAAESCSHICGMRENSLVKPVGNHSVNQELLINGYYSYFSQLLCGWDRKCFGIPALTANCVPRSEARESADQSGWPFKNNRLWICQKTEGSHLDIVRNARVYSTWDNTVQGP